MHFRFKTAAAALIAATLLQVLPASAELTEVRMALGWIRNGQYAPLMVADVKGYFKDEGLKITFVDGGPGKNPLPTVGAGQAQFGIFNAAQIFLARLAPDPVDIVAIGAMAQQSPSAYIMLADKGAKDPTPKDLEGKVLGLQADGPMYFDAIAHRFGIDPKKVKIRIVQGTAEPLMVGRIDFFSGMLSNQTYQIETEAVKADAAATVKGKEWRGLRLWDFGVRAFHDVLFTQGATIRENPELVRKFMRAVARGLDFTIKNPDEAIKLVDSYPGQAERADKLAWRLKIQNAYSVSADTAEHGLLWMNPTIWEENIGLYKEAKQIPRTIPVSDFATNEFNAGIR